MKTILYSCAFVPKEWIAAHGWRPVRITPQSTSSGLKEGMCAFVNAFVPYVCINDADAIIMSTVCDQMRRAADLVEANITKPVFVLNVPSTWQSRSVRDFYREELKRLGEFLVRLGGTSPSKDHLAHVMLEYEQKRKRPGIPPGIGIDRLLPLALVGGELLGEDRAIFDLVEAAGGQIVLDATDFGDRGRPGPFDPHRLALDPLGELVHAYFATIPHAFRRPNTQLYRYLQKELADRKVCGVIFRKYPWCDLWNAELPRMRTCIDIPFLELDTRSGGSDQARMAYRIRAFLEVLH